MFANLDKYVILVQEIGKKEANDMAIDTKIQGPKSHISKHFACRSTGATDQDVWGTWIVTRKNKDNLVVGQITFEKPDPETRYCYMEPVFTEALSEDEYKEILAMMLTQMENETKPTVVFFGAKVDVIQDNYNLVNAMKSMNFFLDDLDNDYVVCEDSIVNAWFLYLLAGCLIGLLLAGLLNLPYAVGIIGVAALMTALSFFLTKKRKDARKALTAKRAEKMGAKKLDQPTDEPADE